MYISNCRRGWTYTYKCILLWIIAILFWKELQEPMYLYCWVKVVYIPNYWQQIHKTSVIPTTMNVFSEWLGLHDLYNLTLFDIFLKIRQCWEFDQNAATRLKPIVFLCFCRMWLYNCCGFNQQISSSHKTHYVNLCWLGRHIWRYTGRNKSTASVRPAEIIRCYA